MFRIRQGYAELMSNVDMIKSTINTDVEDGIRKAKDYFHEQITIFETNTIQSINNHKEELVNVKKQIDSLADLTEEKVNENVTFLNQKIRKKYLEVSSKYNDHYVEIQEKFISLHEQLEKDFMASEQSNSDKFEDFSSQYNELKDNIAALKNSIKTEITETIEEGKIVINKNLQTIITNSQDNFIEYEVNFKAELDKYKKEFVKLQGVFKQAEDRFTSRFLEHSDVLDRRIAQIESEVKRFEKHTQLFDKTNSLKDKLSNEVKVIMDNLDEVKRSKIEVDEIERKIAKVHEVAVETDTKYASILSSSRKIDNIEEHIAEMNTYIDDAEIRFNKITESKIALIPLKMRLIK